MEPFEIRVRYQLGFWFAVAVLGALPPLAVWLGATTEAWVEAPLFIVGFAAGPVLLLGLFLALSPHTLRFDGSGFRTDRYVFPSRRFAYSDVIDIGALSVRTRRGRIRLVNTSNGEEVKAAFDRLVAFGMVPEFQLEGRVESEERADLTAAFAMYGAAGTAWAFWLITGSTPARAELWTIVLMVGVGAVVYVGSRLRSARARSS